MAPDAASPADVAGHRPGLRAWVRDGLPTRSGPMLKEFKAFILKGNLVEIAVAFIMALAFAAMVASFVADIITPIIAAIFGQPDFSSLKIDIGDSAITYGKFLN